MEPPAENPLEPPKRESMMGPIIELLIVHGIALMLLCGIFTTVGWKFQRVFESFGTELPVLTVVMLKVSALARQQPLALPILVMGLLAADAAVYYALRQSDNRTGARVWYGVILGIECAAIALAVYALFLPLIELMTKVGQSAGG